MRYLRQQDRFRCGPIALINLHKWMGLSATRGDLGRYQRLCQCEPERGTPRQAFSQAVGKQGRRVSYHSFKSALQFGGSAVLLTRKPSCRNGHYWFVAGIAQRSDGEIGFLGVNKFIDETLTLVAYARMKWLLQYSVVWTF